VYKFRKVVDRIPFINHGTVAIYKVSSAENYQLVEDAEMGICVCEGEATAPSPAHIFLMGPG
jgi:hypothetical protein